MFQSNDDWEPSDVAAKRASSSQPASESLPRSYGTSSEYELTCREGKSVVLYCGTPRMGKAPKGMRYIKLVSLVGAEIASDDEADHESVATMVERGYEVDYLALRRAMEQGDSLDVGWSGTRNALEMIASVVAAGGGGFSATAGSDGEGGIALPEVDVEGFVKSFPLFSMFGKNDDEA